jgi:hypothetical protein
MSEKPQEVTDLEVQRAQCFAAIGEIAFVEAVQEVQKKSLYQKVSDINTKLNDLNKPAQVEPPAQTV